MFSDPDWYFWAAFDKRIFHGVYAEEFAILEYRACNIKIPTQEPKEWRIRYLMTHDGKFADFEIIEATTPEQRDSATMFRDDRLDLSVPYQLKRYDKKGCRLLLTKFKYYYLDRRDARFTKKWCEDFFANPNNFAERRDFGPPGLQNLNVDPCGFGFGSKPIFNPTIEPSPPEASAATTVTEDVVSNDYATLDWLLFDSNVGAE